jgi:hypothetical protein
MVYGVKTWNTHAKCGDNDTKKRDYGLLLRVNKWLNELFGGSVASLSLERLGAEVKEYGK